jgi:hypothetical protein
MSRRRSSVVTVLSGGLSLSLAACAGKEGPSPEINPPPQPPVESIDGEQVEPTDEQTVEGKSSGRTVQALPSNPPRPAAPTQNPAPAQTEEADPKRLPVWDEVESGHPKGATNPPRPVLEILADGARCWKAWEGGMRRPDPELMAIGGRILDDASQTQGTEIECPRRRVQSVLDRKMALDEGPK